MQIQAFVAKFPSEALQMPILGGFAGLDKVQEDLVGIGPGIQALSSEFGSVVERNAFGHTIPGNELVQDTQHPLTG